MNVTVVVSATLFLENLLCLQAITELCKTFTEQPVKPGMWREHDPAGHGSFPGFARQAALFPLMFPFLILRKLMEQFREL